MKIRTKVYRSILQSLGDRRWHDVKELGRVTTFPDLWLKELERDPCFEIDGSRQKLRLRPH